MTKPRTRPDRRRSQHERMGFSARKWMRMRAGKLMTVPLSPGAHLVPHCDSAMAPCGCVTHVAFAIPATSVQWTVKRVGNGQWRYQLRCMACGRSWSRQVPDISAGRSYLLLDATHPEEKRAKERRERIAMRAFVRRGR
jgi:hypothetical protein